MKTLIATGAFVLALAGSAQAQDMFAHMGSAQEEGTSTIVIDPFTATEDGFIAIYDHHRGVVGPLLGVASVREGANRETRVNLGHPVTQDVIALLFNGTEFSNPDDAVDSVEIDIEE